MDTVAVILEAPERIALRSLALSPPADGDVLVKIEQSGISAGTEKLLWSGRMPGFPGMGYPLVPGYESVGHIVAGEGKAAARVGERVFVPGSTAFVGARGLFGGSASHVRLPSSRAIRVGEELGEEAILLALAATARHAIAGGRPADLVIGHGVLGRLIARLSVAAGGSPTVWETRSDRRSGAVGYRCIDPVADERSDYRSIYDASGDSDLLGPLIARLAKGGEIVLAGFYERPLSFDFAPAFMREARIRIAAEWRREDMDATLALVASGALLLGGLITHRGSASDAAAAYPAAFGDRDCLKMILDWKGSA